jgi:hypothetical protein
MTGTRHTIAGPLRVAVLAIAPGTLCVATPASADTRMGVNVSVGGSVDSNPYLTNGGGVDVSGSVQIDPWLKLSDEVSSLNVFGSVTARQYAKSANGTDISGTLNMAGSHRLSPYVTVNGGVSYLTSRNGINQGFFVVNPNDPAPPITTPLPDISLAGTRTRSQSMTANAGISARLSALDQLGGSVTVSRSTYDSPAGNDFNYLNGALNYSHTLSERMAITASVRYGKSNYFGTRVGDGTIISPEAGIDMKLSENLTLNASLGVSFSRSQLASGAKTKATALSGNARLCRTQIGGAMCLVAARTAQPTGLGSIETLTSISVNYDTRLSSRDSINAGIGANFSNRDTAPVTGPRASKYYSANATWSHSFSRRLSGYVSPSYSRVSDPSNSYDSFRVSAGLRLTFGAIS